MTRQFGRREDRARVAAGAEGGVDIDAAVARLEEVDRGTAEHGNVTSQSASDSRGVLSLPVIIPVLRADLPPLPGSRAAS